MSKFSTRCVALAFLAMGALSAAEPEALPYGVECKLRYGYGFSDPDKLSGGLMSFAGGGFYKVGLGRINADLGYQWKSGSQYLEPAGTPYPGRVAPDFGSNSRRNSLSGLTLRVSYAYPIFEDLYVQAGLQGGGAKFKQEYVGEWADHATNTYDNTFNGTPVKSSSAITPFLGIRYDASRDMGFELNILSLNYTALNFHTTPGAPLVSGSFSTPGPLVYQGDVLTETKRSVMHIELAYVFRF